ncbi:MAG: 3,4-dihydroxy-2-butanone-4-phosphate synthase, partial [Promethearchaeota archaeon]
MNENVRNAISDLAKGKFVLVYDIDGREEEVDLVCLAQ